MHAGNVHLPPKMYQPNFDSEGTVKAPGSGADPNSCSLPQVAKNAAPSYATRGGNGHQNQHNKENAHQYQSNYLRGVSKVPNKDQRTGMNGGMYQKHRPSQPKYSQAANLPMYTHQNKQYGVGAAGRPRQPKPPLGGGYQNKYR